jgi:8-oxo-dGTP pyrophosphatase MutT (NUDIX family)
MGNSTTAGSDSVHPEIALDGTRPPDEFIVSAVLWVPASAENDGRYLMQLRDDKPGLPLRNTWALFGGHVDPGETGEAALVRELGEELSYKPRSFRWYLESIMVLPRRKARVVRKVFYLVPIAAADIDTMVQGEGADMRLFTITALLSLPNIAPHDLAVIMTHARERLVYVE